MSSCHLRARLRFCQAPVVQRPFEVVQLALVSGVSRWRTDLRKRIRSRSALRRQRQRGVETGHGTSEEPEP